MKKTLLLIYLCSFDISEVHAISKKELLKLPQNEREKYAVVVGISSEYAIPDEEYSKLPPEIQTAISLEKGRARIQYAIANLGKKELEVDVSQLYDLGRGIPIIPGDSIVNYGTIGRLYHGAVENNFKSAEYLYKDYLEWKKFVQEQPSLWWPGGSQDPLGWLVSVYIESKMYKEWDALYSDYNEFWWKRQAEPYCKQFPHIKDCVNTRLNTNPDYQDFVKEWKGIKKLAKTSKPKPLDPTVQNHEWFYSDKQEEVLKALEYYHASKVNFMLEKALKHKDPVIAVKAKEYLESLTKGSGDETKH